MFEVNEAVSVEPVTNVVSAIDEQSISAQSQINPILSMCFGYNSQDNKPASLDMTFDELAEQFGVPGEARGKLSLEEYLALDKTIKAQREIRAAEKDGLYFIPVSFAIAGTRKAEYVSSISCFVIDIDTGDITRNQIEEKLSGLKYLAYSSYSHHPDFPRWRAVIPYSVEIAPSEHENIYQYFQNLFDGKLDTRCKTINQIWYTPACPHDALEHFVSFVGDGEYLDVSTLPIRNVPQVIQIDSALITSPRTQLPVVSSTHYSTRDLEKVKSALDVVPSDDYDPWIKVGLALFNSFGQHGYDIWIEWSMKSSKFDLASANDAWESFSISSKENKATFKSIFYMATELGWNSSKDYMPEYIAEINKNHFMAFEGGNVYVFAEDTDPITGYPKLVRIRTSGFKEYYSNHTIVIDSDDGDKKICPAKLWLEHPKRRSYKGLIFDPSGKAPYGYYNLWRGFAYQPIQGDWSKYQNLIREVICDGNNDDYEYLLNWMAYAVQKPGKAGEVAVVLRGERGTGKGKFIGTFMKLFGQHGQQVINPKHLVGNFNANLRDCVLLFADEAFFAGDKQGIDILKGLITEPTIKIEPKGIDSITVPNYLHIMMASNSDWVVPAGEHERRFFVLDVGMQHMQDHPYFAAIDIEMNEQGGLEALLHDLLGRDISQSNIRDVRCTSALDEQKIRSLGYDKMWWMDILGGTYKPKEWQFQNRKSLGESFSKAVSTSYDKGSITKLGMFLKKVLPEGYPKKEQRKEIDTYGKSSLVDFYEFPLQDECKAQFMKKLGLQKSPWD